MQFFDEMLSWKIFNIKEEEKNFIKTKEWSWKISLQLEAIIENVTDSLGSSHFSFLVYWSLHIWKSPPRATNYFIAIHSHSWQPLSQYYCRDQRNDSQRETIEEEKIEGNEEDVFGTLWMLCVCDKAEIVQGVNSVVI